jgi:thiamine-phosphate pyrophosphorylase
LPPTTDPVLCYVTGRRLLAVGRGLTVEEALVETAARAASAGVDWIQIREKDLAANTLLQLTTEILHRSPAARILVNDRLDVALAAGAAGVHLGGESLPVAPVRRWCHGHAPEGFHIGRSCHSLEEARAAEKDGSDYVFFGPVFATPSKLAYGPPQGTGRLGAVCRALSIPVVAIGGITPQNAGSCIAAGAAGVAAIRWFQEPGELTARLATLRAACR